MTKKFVTMTVVEKNVLINFFVAVTANMLSIQYLS
jgi:hypothetical protein